MKMKNRAIKRAGCFHWRGHKDPCHASTSPYIAIYGVMQIVFSQIPDLDKVWWLSTVASIMSFSYSTIGISWALRRSLVRGDKWNISNQLCFSCVDSSDVREKLQ